MFTFGCSTVAERLGNGETRQGHRGTGTGRLVHLTIHQRCLTLLHFGIIHFGEIPFATLHGFHEFLAILHHSALNHFAKQVVTLTGTFAHTGKHREAVMTLGDVVDKFHDEHGLSHTGTAEETNLTALHVRLQQVNHLDTGIKHFTACFQFLELRRFAVDGISSLSLAQLFQTVNALTRNVHHASLDLHTCGHRNRSAQRTYGQATLQTVSVVHCHGAHCVFTDMLLHFHHNGATIGVSDFQGFMNFGENFVGLFAVCLEANIDHRADNLRDASLHQIVCVHAFECFYF